MGGTTAVEPRETWREFAKAWPLFDGTASGYWMRDSFEHVFGLSREVNAENADALFDELDAKLKSPAFRPRQLFKDFNIEVLATTDDPLDDLAAHAAIAKDPTFAGPGAAHLPPGRLHQVRRRRLGRSRVEKLIERCR